MGANSRSEYEVEGPNGLKTDSSSCPPLNWKTKIQAKILENSIKCWNQLMKALIRR